jgi:hypothetical protein
MAISISWNSISWSFPTIWWTYLNFHALIVKIVSKRSVEAKFLEVILNLFHSLASHERHQLGRFRSIKVLHSLTIIFHTASGIVTPQREYTQWDHRWHLRTPFELCMTGCYLPITSKLWTHIKILITSISLVVSTSRPIEIEIEKISTVEMSFFKLSRKSQLSRCPFQNVEIETLDRDLDKNRDFIA